MPSAGRRNVGGMANSLLAYRSSRRQLIKHAALASLGSTAVFEALSMWSAQASAATLATRAANTRAAGGRLMIGGQPSL